MVIAMFLKPHATILITWDSHLMSAHTKSPGERTGIGNVYTLGTLFYFFHPGGWP
jgi:predicted nucleic acid-binding protein